VWGWKKQGAFSKAIYGGGRKRGAVSEPIYGAAGKQNSFKQLHIDGRKRDIILQ